MLDQTSMEQAWQRRSTVDPGVTELRREPCGVVRDRTADLAAVPEQDILPWDVVTAQGLRRLYRELPGAGADGLLGTEN